MTSGLYRALLNKYALGTALALVIAPLASIDPAMATCTADPTLANTFNCTGTVNNTAANGFDTAVTPATVNVLAGAAVSGTPTGINLEGSGTVVSAGSITGVTGGIVAAGPLSVALSGGLGFGVTTTGANASAISSVGNLLLNNDSGTSITAMGDTSKAVSASGNASVRNTGAITAKGVGSTAIFGGGGVGLVSTGSVTGDAFGINVGTSADITNNLSGTIAANAANGIAIFAGDPTNNDTGGTITLANAGSVQATTAIDAQFVNVTSNTGKISGVNTGIEAISTATITNSLGGTIEATAAGGVAIFAGDTNHNNAGGTVNLANAGTVQATGTGGIAIAAATVNVTSNTNMIVGDAFAIDASAATIVNNVGGTIQANASNPSGSGGVAIHTGPGGTITLVNAGTVQANGTNGVAILSNDPGTVTLANTGTVQATGIGGTAIVGGTVNVTSNTGLITGSANGIIADEVATIVNNVGGTISGTGFGGIGIFAVGTLSLVNAGTVSGTTAIFARNAATITNFGTIQSTAGASGIAIQLSGAADTLNIKNGSKIIGMIDMGGGADVINVDSAPSVAKGLSMLSRAAGAVVDALKQQLTSDFTGVINIIGGGASTSGQPAVTVNGLTASVDPTALSQQDRALMDFTGGMSMMVQGRLGGAATGSGPMAMSYAAEDANAQMFSKAMVSSWNAPITVWSSGFGAVRSQSGTDTTLNSNSNVAGGVIGVDRRIQPNWLVGMFAGGGSGSINVDLSSQKINTDYFSGGVYSRYEWGPQFVDATLQAGTLNNRSTRLVQNNISGGLENATASYNGWFISPEIAYGYRINFGETVVTPMARIRYVAGILDGYNEAGSAQTLSIGSRTLQDFEERGEVEVSKTGLFGNAALRGWARGGVIALQRAGDTTVNAVLIGQSLSFITPGKNSAVGGVGSVGFDYHVSPNVALFGSLEGMAMSDQSRVGSAKSGVKVAF